MSCLSPLFRLALRSAAALPLRLPYRPARAAGLFVASCVALALLPVASAQKTEEAQPEITEKELLAEFGDAYRNSQPVDVRVAAITALGEASRELPDGGASKAVTRALLKGLEDEDLEVQSATVAQLRWGRPPDQVISALDKYIEDVKKEVEKRITRPDDESRDYVNRGSRLFGEAADVLGLHPDDRAVDALVSQLKSLRANSASNNLSTRLVGRNAAALLRLGSFEAVQACVRQAGVYSNDDGFQDSAARELHRELSVFATRVGKAPPDFGINWYVAWSDWFEKWEDDFPKKLGKLKDPIPEPPSESSAMRTDPDDGGAAPR